MVPGKDRKGLRGRFLVAAMTLALLAAAADSGAAVVIASHDARVTAISRLGIDKVVSYGREERPFVLALTTDTGVRRDLARTLR